MAQNEENMCWIGTTLALSMRIRGFEVRDSCGFVLG